LAIELIAMDQILEDDVVVYGAISTGNSWQFGLWHRDNKQLVQDFNLFRSLTFRSLTFRSPTFRSPTDLEALLRVLVAMLGSL